jgi:hypothetical protein
VRSLDDQGAISLRHTPLELYVGGVLGSTARLDVDVRLGGGLDVISAQVRRSGCSRKPISFSTCAGALRQRR